MKQELGIWIDRQRAFIVRLTNEGAETQAVQSNLDRHVRFTGGTRSKLRNTIQAAEDKQERKYLSQLNHYYDRVVKQVSEADSILVIGPGEAKLELGKRLALANMGGRVVGFETVDKMTEGQIVVKVRNYFLNRH
jgi:stalled ribosome rescue protein Dom34